MFFFAYAGCSTGESAAAVRNTLELFLGCRHTAWLSGVCNFFFGCVVR
jgi:hypothetical protein